MSQFIEDKSSKPYAFIQWKGTDVCMDFWCDCGAHMHIDATFAYGVKCNECGTKWEMPSFVIPRRAAARWPGPFVTEEVEDEQERG